MAKDELNKMVASATKKRDNCNATFNLANTEKESFTYSKTVGYETVEDEIKPIVEKQTVEVTGDELNQSALEQFGIDKLALLKDIDDGKDQQVAGIVKVRVHGRLKQSFNPFNEEEEATEEATEEAQE